MSAYRIIINLVEQPRAVELEVVAPLGTRSIEPVDDALLRCGVRAVGKVVFTTASHTVFSAKLVESNHVPLEPERIGFVLRAVRANMAGLEAVPCRAA